MLPCHIPCMRINTSHLVVSLRCVLLLTLLALPFSSFADWRVASTHDQRQTRPPKNAGAGTAIKPGDRWPTDQKFRWLIGDLQIPETIGKEPSAGKTVGLQISCGDGGEIFIGDQVQCRFDNDHPGLVVVAEKAEPGAEVRLAVQVYGKVQGGDKFDQATWVIIDQKRSQDRLALTVDAAQVGGKVPNGIVGLSQGGGMSDYEDATAKKLQEGGFRWFRMDNVFTPVWRKDKQGNLTTNWADFDKRVDFMYKIGADPIIAVSYMPQVLDAVPNNERQSAPKDYAAWEELCFQAAKRSLERGKRVPFWEVWNEVNTGWLKPGPEDTGSESFQKLYAEALGKPQTNLMIIRRFEAYCKLYRASARGIRRADPQAKIGGPALASGPMESSERGHAAHGKGFARGLMLWCQQENLPLDFVSWHEYFQSADVIAKEAETFRKYLNDFPALKQTVQSFMITEWNEAWWPDRPQDHELGAAWCANSITRAFIPAAIDRPCFFYVKQGDMGFRGDYSLLMKDNVPKASYNVAKIFNGLSGNWVTITGTDGDISGVAAWDATKGRLAVVLVNFRDRYALRRHVSLSLQNLPKELAGGTWQQWTVDATHSNVWNNQGKPELARTRDGELEGQPFQWQETLMPNSVTLLELVRK
ncbi:MAG: Beta-xylosidase [Verrucomicrobiales bacterium]|nr:Beta-xylosidase [Verrucomicrobiales bacterium]